MSRLRLFWALVLLAGCLGGDSNPLQPLPRGGHHLLFIGNSLTYVNDLLATLAQLAASVGDTIHTAMVALPDYAVIDHANGGPGGGGPDRPLHELAFRVAAFALGCGADLVSGGGRPKTFLLPR